MAVMRDKEEIRKTTCCYCGVGCGILVKKDKNERLSVAGDPQHPVNKGMLCSKGMNLHYTAMDRSDRLLYPAWREDIEQPLARITWDEAIRKAAEKFRAIIREHGPDAVGFYISGQCLTEEYYLANKIVKGFIGTNNIDTNSRLCMSSAVSAYKLALGEDSVPGCYEDIELADTFLIAGANPAWCHPILFRRIEAHKEKNSNVKLIVVDPRRTQTAAVADLHLQIFPGTDIVLYHAIARGLIENGFMDEQFILEHTVGFDALKQKVMERTLQEAAAICRIKFTDIYKAVKYIGSSGGFISMWAMGLNQSVVGVHKNLALINLSLITGKIGKPGSGPFSLTGQPNAMGGREVGGMATLLSAHRNMGDPAHRKEIADYWKVADVPAKPGLTATEMFTALRDGKMKAIWIISTNPMVSIPDSNLAEAALKKADCVVVQEMSARADTLRYAHLVLPAATWLEKEGTMTNSERRISHLSKVIDPPGEALPDAGILLKFAREMGWEDAFDYRTVSEIYDEHAGLTANTRIDVSGLHYDRLKNTGSVQWPVPPGSLHGTQRLFTDHWFYHPDGKARISAVSDENLSEPLSEAYPLILITGRIRDQWHTMTRSGKVNKLRQHIPQPFLEIHPADAEKRNIREGDPVIIENARGKIQVTAVVSDAIKRGVVFLPMHWGRIVNHHLGRTNNLTGLLTDPVSRQPDFKFSAVEATLYQKPVQKIVIVGEGPEIITFLKQYRKLNTTDEISWFCGKEPVFQNASLLMNYVTAAYPPLNLSTLDDVAEPLNVRLLKDAIVRSIDKKKKVITAADNSQHAYDILLLCGVYAAADEKQAGAVISLGTLEAAEQLRSYIHPGNKIILAGDDPALLSLSAHLSSRGVEAALIIPGSGMLQHLADEVAGSMVETLLVNAGVTIRYHEKIMSVRANGPMQEVLLQSGESVNAHAVLQLPRCRLPENLTEQLGLHTDKGIVVDEYLQSNEPGVFSIGRAARYDALYSPEAGQRQAVCLSDYLHGNLLNYYTGTVPFCEFDIAGVQVSIAGDVRVPAGDAGYEEIISLDKHQFYYKKCVIRNDRLVGVIFIGDDQEMREYRLLIEQGTELGDKRSQLLRSGNKKTVMIGRMVCSCNQVGEGNIEQAIRNGCHSLESIMAETRAGTGCGSCKPELKGLLKKIKR